MQLRFILILFFFCSCQFQKNEIIAKETPTFSIVIHGGAGTILKKNMSKEMEEKYCFQRKEVNLIMILALIKQTI